MSGVGRQAAWIAAALAALLPLAAATGCGTGAKKPPRDRYAGFTPEQIHDMAVRQAQKRNHHKARELYQKALSRSELPPALVASIHLGLADAYFEDGGILNLAEALSRYTNFLTFYPNHERADYAQFQLGLCYLKQAANPDRDQAQTRKALDELLKVGRLYPNSRHASEAEERAGEAREILAEHEFRIGKFYFRRQSWTGAIDRFRLALEVYPGYSRKDELYLLLGQSLGAQDKKDEARLFLEKLIVEFPSSPHASTARSLLDRPTSTAEGRP